LYIKTTENSKGETNRKIELSDIAESNIHQQVFSPTRSLPSSLPFLTVGSPSNRSDDSFGSNRSFRSPLRLYHPAKRNSYLGIIDQAKQQNEDTWNHVVRCLTRQEDASSSSSTGGSQAIGVYARVRCMNKNEADMQSQECLSILEESPTIRIRSVKDKTKDFT
jgi:hypothetical protein